MGPQRVQDTKELITKNEQIREQMMNEIDKNIKGLEGKIKDREKEQKNKKKDSAEIDKIKKQLLDKQKKAA